MNMISIHGNVHLIQPNLIMFVWLSLSVTYDRSWFSPGTLVSSTNKTDCHDIAEILLKVALSTMNMISIHGNVHLIQPNLIMFVSDL
jgi:hypothetical protein